MEKKIILTVILFYLQCKLVKKLIEFRKFNYEINIKREPPSINHATVKAQRIIWEIWIFLLLGIPFIWLFL